jgi:hypothetical protein
LSRGSHLRINTRPNLREVKAGITRKITRKCGKLTTKMSEFGKNETGLAKKRRELAKNEGALEKNGRALTREIKRAQRETCAASQEEVEHSAFGEKIVVWLKDVDLGLVPAKYLSAVKKRKAQKGYLENEPRPGAKRRRIETSPPSNDHSYVVDYESVSSSDHTPAPKWRCLSQKSTSSSKSFSETEKRLYNLEDDFREIKNRVDVIRDHFWELHGSIEDRIEERVQDAIQEIMDTIRPIWDIVMGKNYHFGRMVASEEP